jgi:hypothetical protein
MVCQYILPWTVWLYWLSGLSIVTPYCSCRKCMDLDWFVCAIMMYISLSLALFIFLFIIHHRSPAPFTRTQLHMNLSLSRSRSLYVFISGPLSRSLPLFRPSLCLARSLSLSLSMNSSASNMYNSFSINSSNWRSSTQLTCKFHTKLNL